MVVSAVVEWVKTENFVFKSEFAWETGILNCKTSPAGEIVVAEILFVWSQEVTAESASEVGLTYSATCAAGQNVNRKNICMDMHLQGSSADRSENCWGQTPRTARSRAQQYCSG